MQNNASPEGLKGHSTMSQISFNPMLTSNAAGSFGTDWTGGFQGSALADPAVRFQLAGGRLNANDALPMWGGVGITENVATQGAGTQPSSTLGGVISRATTIAAGAGQLTGFSVFDQNYAAINTPQSPVPLSGSNMLVNFYRFNTNARIWLAVNSALLNFAGDIISTPVSWDFGAQEIVPFIAAYPQLAATSATYTSATGILAITFPSAPVPVVGDQVSVFGFTPASLNGSWPVTAVAGNIMSLQLPSGMGTIAPTGGTLQAGGGALPIRGILRVEAGNSMTVNYTPATGVASWNRSGSTALVLL